MDEHPTAQENVPGPARPEKLIRTFAGDMETLKGGGIPNLAPLRGSVPAPVPAPAEVSVSTSSVKPMPLQTYADDFSQRMKETRASAATVLAVEQDSATSAPRTEEPPASSRGNLLYVVAGIMLLIAGGVGAYAVYTRSIAQMQPILVPGVSAPIFVDEREQISGTGTALTQAIVQSATRPFAAGTVRFLHLDPSITTESVFSSLRVPAPDILRRNIHVAGSMAGVVSAGGNRNPFFILSVVSYSDTFSGLLSWEPQMPHDLEALFPPYPAPPSFFATSTVATSTAKTGTKAPTKATTTPSISSPSKQTFDDEVIRNHDVRVYRDVSGKSVLLYGYWNQTTLVIARDEAAFAEIIGRLATSRTR